jgi:hypothetical protein
MGGTGAAADDLKGQYIVAIYFVTTTLSTCGFGDISASSGDAIEALVIMIFQFVGMLFYSSTIDKVQSFLISDDVSPNDYANSMVEVLESLIVKVGKNLPLDRQIPGEIIKEWKIHTVRYFQHSPSV